jgi:hypothetical protein
MLPLSFGPSTIGFAAGNIWKGVSMGHILATQKVEEGMGARLVWIDGVLTRWKERGEVGRGAIWCKP